MKEKKRASKTDWARVDAMTDDEIDYSDNPELTDEFWDNAVMYIGNKKAISIRLDEDIYDYFKESGKGYQTAINKVLRQYMEAQQRKSR